MYKINRAENNRAENNILKLLNKESTYKNGL